MNRIRHGIFSSQNRAQYAWVLIDSTGDQGGFSADLEVTDTGSDDETMAANIEAIYPAALYPGQTVNYFNSEYVWYSLFSSTQL